MKSKSPLSLIEQLLMLLVFAIAAAVCVRAFVWADDRSEYNARRAEAAISVQSAADTVKHYRGDLEKTAAGFGGEISGTTLTKNCGDYTVRISVSGSTGTPTGSAEITAEDGSGKKLLTVTAVWQEAAE